jgi:NAD-dependent deacetylase
MGAMDADALAHARHLVASSRRPVVFTGAGVSADSGVPTFRGASDHALWSKYDPTQLASPQGFAADPKLVYDWYTWRRSKLAAAEPNAAHVAIGKLQRERGAVLITQNVDDLHERVAPPDAVIHKLHGKIADDSCSRCAHRERVDFSNPPPLRRCPKCASLLRPAVVWFGESLDQGTWTAAQDATRWADLLLVVGTSGRVYPAASLVELAACRCPVVVVNPEPTPFDGAAAVTLHGRAAAVVPLLVE